MPDQNQQSVQPKPTRSKAETVLTQYYRVFFVAAAIGLGAILLFPLQAASLAQYFSVFTTSLLFAAAFLAVGSLAGFLFGIPYTNKEDAGQPEEPESGIVEEQKALAAGRTFKPYRPNTNLEQISDWLTKILVGVGLVQLAQLPGALQAFNVYVSPALGGWKSSGYFGVAILIYFLVLGFLLLFLWTRVNLPLLYAQSDVDQNQAYEDGVNEGIVTGENKATAFYAEKLAPQLGIVGATRSLEPKTASEAKHLLWVDDHPENNRNEKHILEGTMNVNVEICLSTNEALDKFEKTRYDLIISDMGRGIDRQAGLDLLTKLRISEEEKSQGYTPFIIYSSRPASAEVESKIGRLGAITTNSPLVLIDKATAILKR